ncbi:saccharopine dehydrogenase [Auriculariales sp. MPI-PUGE-AT-0066]|nr:saccharopine dehydrogenase [Auriculariales sp. MPI-PUGE-AT-0066]
MTSPKVDVLLIGGTGYTGKLILRYLASHSERNNFKLGVTARTAAKGRDLLVSLNLKESDVTLYDLDLANIAQIDKTVSYTKVVINAVGPFWLHSTPVITACARLGVHYVDITAETFWIRNILDEVHTLALRSGAIIVPSCGFDSVPADLSTFLSVRTLQRSCEARGIAWPGAISSETGIIGDITPSGGTLATILLTYSSIPRDALRPIFNSYCLSPVTGLNQDILISSGKSTLHTDRPYKSIYPLATSDRAIVSRSWGLLESHIRATDPELQVPSYGDKFTYEEFTANKNAVVALFQNVMLVVAGYTLFIPPVRWLITKVVPVGTGPSLDALKKGHLKVVNVTRLNSDLTPPVDARTEIKFNGEAGYLGTSVIISEAALALLRPRDQLEPLARQGGLLTVATAFGSALAERISRTELIEISSSIV